MKQNNIDYNVILFERIFLIIILLILILSIIYLLYIIFRSPFHYPYFKYDFDVTGKRNPKIEDLLDKFLNSGNFILIQRHNEKIQAWKLECEKRIRKSIMKKYRRKQYKKCLNDNEAYRFRITRNQTRYYQRNYVRTPYQVTIEVDSYVLNYNWFVNRNEKLREINYQCTLNEYYSKDQRRLMTPDLRYQIMQRDNYTCQICGKYMPDEVGLHIDHIISVSKGGKTIPSNLQVLCSKCNGSKSNK